MANLGTRAQKAEPIEVDAPPAHLGIRAPSPMVLTNETRQPRPDILASSEFMFIHHWMNWQVQAGKLVPCLGPVRLHGGLNSVKVRRDKATGRDIVNARSYIDRKQEQGWIVLASLELRTHYSVCHLNTKDEEVWLDRWSKPVPGSSEIIADEVGYVAWLESLVANGTLPEIRRFVLEALLKKKAQQLEAESAQLEKMPARRKQLEADLAVLQAAWDAGRGT
jgi:hypothetical protein